MVEASSAAAAAALEERAGVGDEDTLNQQNGTHIAQYF